MKRFVRPLLNCAIVGGLVLAAWPIAQTGYGMWNQRTLAAQWQQTEAKSEAPKPKLLSIKKSELKPKKISKSKPQNWPLTKISIPDIGLTAFVVQGMDDASLKRGPGHDANSSLPGEGNCVIAGHRNVYGSWFNQMDKVMPGAEIILENREGRFVYHAGLSYATPDTNLTVLAKPAAGETPVLTLITCTLPHTSNRIILTAQLDTSQME